jgi:CHAT domain-containing protein/tetratricopeptide (TPR) repeat protein
MPTANVMTKAALMFDFSQPASFAEWRRQFLRALDEHEHATCDTLLALLAQSPQAAHRQAHTHYRAVLHGERHQYDRAEPLLRSLLQEELTPEQRPRTLLELAILLDELGEWHESEQMYRAAAEAYRAVGNTLGRAKVYNNLAISLCYQAEQESNVRLVSDQRLRDALVCHQQAADLLAAYMATVDDRQRAEICAEVDDETAKAWHGRAKVYAQQGQFAAAEDAFRRYLAATEGNLHVRGYTLTDLAARVYLPQNQVAQAAAALEEAITLLDAHDDALNLVEAQTTYGHVLARQGQAEAALAAYEAAVATAESIRRGLRVANIQAQYRAQVDAAYQAPVDFHLHRGDAPAAFTASERAKARVLADALTGLAALTAEEVQAQLPTQSALVSYTADGAGRLWVMVVTRDTVHAIQIPAVTLRWLQSYLADYFDPDGPWHDMLVPLPGRGYLRPNHLFAGMYKVLVQPIRPLLESMATIYFAATGPLHYLPLGALSPEEGKNRVAALPLLAGRRIVYVPCATLLLGYCHRRLPSTKQGILAVAPPDPKLRYTQGAAQELARRTGDLALTGQGATRQALLAHAGEYRVVCFLGHAVFDQRYAMASHLKLENGTLRADEILTELHMDVDLAILAACETGRGRILRGDEILGLSRALLHAGATAVLVTLWPVHEIATRLLLQRLFADMQTASGRADTAAALAGAQLWLRELTYGEVCELVSHWHAAEPALAEAQLREVWRMTHAAGPAPQASDRIFAHPFFWAAYVLIGDLCPPPAKQDPPAS